jgi:sugar phosphate isomerase/epimerase
VFWQAGIRQVELAIGPKPDADAAIAIQEFQQHGIAYRAHHAFVWEATHCPFNLASRFDRVYFARLTDWLASLGITAYSVHAGSYPTKSDKSAAYARFVENVHQLNSLCRTRGITLGVEKMYVMPPDAPNQNLLDNAEQVAQFSFDASDVKLVIDMAHLNI